MRLIFFLEKKDVLEEHPLCSPPKVWPCALCSCLPGHDDAGPAELAAVLLHLRDRVGHHAVVAGGVGA